jgi:hypothetical protein
VKARVFGIVAALFACAAVAAALVDVPPAGVCAGPKPPVMNDTVGLTTQCPNDDTRWYIRNPGWASAKYPECVRAAMLPESPPMFCTMDIDAWMRGPPEDIADTARGRPRVRRARSDWPDRRWQARCADRRQAGAMNGTRVTKQLHLLEPGEYMQGPGGDWFCCTPNGQLGNLGAHHVEEHHDGSITVSPSILVTGGSSGQAIPRIS